MDANLHSYVESTIKDDPVISNRKDLAKVYGLIVAQLIKNKIYRKQLTDYCDSLRQSKNFRDRQMYITIAKRVFKQDNEIFKKHFAKSIGIDLLNEKVKVV